MKTPFPSFRARGAFTLVELLVSTAVFAILAALLLQVFGSVRPSARWSACTATSRGWCNRANGSFLS